LAWLVLTVSLQPVDFMSAFECRHQAPRSARDSGLSLPSYMSTTKPSLDPRGTVVCLCSRTWDWQLSLTLQEGGVGLDELVGLHIADGDTGHRGGVCVEKRVEGVGAVVLCYRNVAPAARFDAS